MSSPWNIIAHHLPFLGNKLTKIKHHDSLQTHHMQNNSLTRFCSSVKSENSFTFQEKMSLFTAGAGQGSITVETAAVLPLFLFFFLSVFSFFQVLHVRGSAQASLCNTVKNLAVLSYAQEENTACLNLGYVQGKLWGDCPSSYLREMKVIHGMAGMKITEAKIREEGELLTFRAEFGIQTVFPYPAPKQVRTFCRVSARAWTGRDDSPAGAGGNRDGNWVYKTVSGSVYHTNPDCSYLNPSISGVTRDEVRQRRNMDGEIYRACGLCSGKGSGVVYITDTGNRYHTDLGCSGLKRTILTVPQKDIGDCPLCSKCGG